jgi:hypothetical protein
VIADRHYNRQKVGSPQFVPPGRCMVLWQPHAFWVTSWPLAEYVKHAWPGAWINSAFRRETNCPGIASEMIRQAIAHTRSIWEAPPLGMVTFVDAEKVRSKRDPGYCYLMAGFKLVGETKGGLLTFQMLPSEMPEPKQIACDWEESAPPAGDQQENS